MLRRIGIKRLIISIRKENPMLSLWLIQGKESLLKM